MAFDVSALSAYTEQQKFPLILRSLLSNKTVSLMQVAPGIKSSETLNSIDTTVVFQANGCGFNSSGTTTLSQRTITVGDIKVNESLCPKTLASKYTQSKLKAGSMGEKESLPFEQEYSELKASGISDAIEVGVWQGDTSSATANLNKFDGMIKILDAANTYVSYNARPGTGTFTSTTGSTTVTGQSSAFTTEVGVGDKLYSGSVLIGTVSSIGSATSITLVANGAAAVTAAAYKILPAASKSFASPILATTGITASNVIGIVDGMWSSLPAAVKGKPDVRIFCGWDVFETYIIALKNANLYHFDPSNSNGEFTIPGTTYKLVAVHGLDSTNRIYSMRLNNMYFGTDLLNELENFEIFFAKEADEIRFKAEFRAGTQIGFPNEVVQFTLA